MGFSLISMGIMVLFSGGYDIQDHILDSTMDLYFVKPVSPVLLILLERANFLRFLVTFPIGAVITAKSFSGHWASYFVALALCIASTLLLGLIKVIFYELAFWLKKMDSVVQIYEAVMEIRQYPLSVFGSRLIKLFTYIVPVAFVATIPTELLTGVLPIKLLVLFLVNGILIFLIHKGIWTLGRRHYESANG
jgi:ABC-2 type transport system permease protein